MIGNIMDLFVCIDTGDIYIYMRSSLLVSALLSEVGMVQLGDGRTR